MPAPLIPALVAIGQAGYQMYQSHKQKEQAKDLKPSNYIPAGVKEAVSNARRDSISLSPGYTRGLEKIRQSTTDSIDAMKRVGGNGRVIQQGVADADAREKELLKDLSVADSAYRANRSDHLNQLLLHQGRYEQENMDAYRATKSALLGASMRNQYNAITTLGENMVSLLPDKSFEETTLGNKAGLTRLEKQSGMLSADRVDQFKKAGKIQDAGLDKLEMPKAKKIGFGLEKLDPMFGMESIYDPRYARHNLYSSIQ